MLSAPTSPTSQNVSNVISSSNTSVAAIANQYGLGYSTPAGNGASVSKPYSNYTPPSGYSPWMSLNQSTNGGTISPYTAYVRPQLDQQNFNARVSEQINGVPSMQRINSGTPGSEVNMGGNGLANPAGFMDYMNYYPK
jgi:hypothetical protein